MFSLRMRSYSTAENSSGPDDKSQISTPFGNLSSSSHNLKTMMHCHKMCSPPAPLQAYFTNLLKERNITISLLEVQIVFDNARLSKKSHARANQRQSQASKTNKENNSKICRWSPSPTTPIRKRLNGLGVTTTTLGKSNTTARDTNSLVGAPKRRTLKSDKWSDSSAKSRKDYRISLPPRLPRSMSAPLVPEDPPVEEPPLRRCTSLDAPILPIRMKSFSSRSKSHSALNKVSTISSTSTPSYCVNDRFG